MSSLTALVTGEGDVLGALRCVSREATRRRCDGSGFAGSPASGATVLFTAGDGTGAVAAMRVSRLAVVAIRCSGAVRPTDAGRAACSGGGVTVTDLVVAGEEGAETSSLGPGAQAESPARTPIATSVPAPDQVFFVRFLSALSVTHPHKVGVGIFWSGLAAGAAVRETGWRPEGRQSDSGVIRVELDSRCRSAGSHRSCLSPTKAVGCAHALGRIAEARPLPHSIPCAA